MTKEFKHSRKKRLIFYSLMLGISVLMGLLPICFVLKGGWGLGGLIFYFYWAFLLLVDIVIYLIYEFRHISYDINFKQQRKISIIYFVISLVYFIYIIKSLVFKTILKFSSETGLFSIIYNVFRNIPLYIVVIIAFNYLYYRSAKKEKNLVVKCL